MVNIKEIINKKKNNTVNYYKKMFYNIWRKGIYKNAKLGLHEFQYIFPINYETNAEIKKQAFEETIKNFKSYGFQIDYPEYPSERIIISWGEK